MRTKMTTEDKSSLWRAKKQNNSINNSPSPITKQKKSSRERKITVVSFASSRRKSDASKMEEFSSTIEKQLKKSVRKQAKELACFFCAFVFYIIFGMFLFFLIEECSNASTPSDNSIIQNDVVEQPKFKNIRKTCENLYQSLKKVENMTTRNISKKNTSIQFVSFYEHCKENLKKATQPIYIKKKTIRLCQLDEYQLLKYAEFTVFTLLLIGYGNTTPETIIGRFTVILYALFGIPIAVTMYSVAGKLMVQLITLFIRMFHMRVLKKNTEIAHLQFKTLGVSFLLFAIIMLIGCAVTTSPHMENLNFSSSLYFWFVSFTTIGYGDVTFQRERYLKSPHLMLVSMCNLLFGLGVLAAIIEAFSLALEKRDLQMSTIILDENGDPTNTKDKVNEEDLDNLLKNTINKYRHIQEDVIDQDTTTCISDLSRKEGSLSNIISKRKVDGNERQ